jgi:hypothetical protein
LPQTIFVAALGPPSLGAFDEREKLDTSGKSPAYQRHRSYQARAGRPAAGFFNSTAFAFATE